MNLALRLATAMLGIGAALVRPDVIQALSPRAAQQPAQVEAEAAVSTSESLFNQSKYPESREQALRALSICERLQDQRGIGAARHVLGLVASVMGETAEARQQFELAISAFEVAGHLRGRGKATLGLLGVWSPDQTTFLQLVERTISDARIAGDRDLEGRTFHLWGDTLFWVGDYEASLEKLEEAAALLATTDDSVALGTVHNSLGRLYRRHGRSDLALHEQLTALALHQKVPTSLQYLQSLNAVGVTYQYMGELTHARAYLDRALIMAEQMASPRVQDFIRGSLASILVEQGQPAQAARLLERVVANGFDNQPLRHTALATAYLGLRRNDDALRAAQRAVELCAAGSATDCVVALQTRSRVYGALHNATAALADLRAAMDRLEEVRTRLVPADFLKQQFAVAQEDIYTRAIAFQFEQAQTAEALETAERARARAFVDLLAANQVAVPDIESTHTSLSTPAPGRIPLVLRGAHSSTSEPSPADAGIDLPSPGSARAAESRDFSALAARLGSTLLVYWVADDGLFIWVVKDGEKIHATRVPVRSARLGELVRATVPFAVNADVTSTHSEPRIVTRGDLAIALSDPDRSAWRELYKLLVRPVRHLLPARQGSLLTIVPHGPLAGLSFAALTNERGRYLLEDYALHYVPAAAVLQYTAAKRQPDVRTGRIMLVADPTLAPRSRFDQTLPRLPGARAEVSSISSLIGRSRTTILEGEAATESTVRLDIGEQSVLHFATHAIVRDDDPLGSFLALRRSTADAAGDGYLTAREIYGLQLRADLVVLSACRSGGGHVTGDGIGTFARAFLYAGTPSVITSLWDVADQPTNRLLPDFYRFWIAGQTKARALRSAALRLVNDLRAGRVEVSTPAGVVTIPDHPIFWAGFALVGEPQ